MAVEVTGDDIKKLRDMVGAGMLDCKKALVEFNLDFDKAADALRARGLAKAAKRADRETSQGRVVAYIHGEGRIGVLVQLNCETDFVARNEDFEKLGHNIAMQIAASAPIAIQAQDIPQELIDRESAIYNEQLLKEGRKPEQIEKILPGKIKKFLSEVSLLDQPYVKDPKITVEDYIKSYIAKFGENITVGKFSRFSVS